MKQPRTLDEARALYPRYAFYLSADPEGIVALDLVDDEGRLLNWQAESEARVWTMAFPVDEPEPLDVPVWPPTEQMQREAAAANPADTGIPTPIGLFD